VILFSRGEPPPGSPAHGRSGRIGDPHRLFDLPDNDGERTLLLWRMDERHTDDILLLPRLTERWKVVMLVPRIDDEALLLYAIRNGVSAVLMDSDLSVAELSDVIAWVLRGGTYFPNRVHELLRDALRVVPTPRPALAGERLSKRERDIMNGIARGLSNDEIAQVLFISKKTVKNHINRLFAKLGARHRTEAMVIWLGAERNVEQPVG
jgi:DNA-binding NarL/FixJ family response regulator